MSDNVHIAIGRDKRDDRMTFRIPSALRVAVEKAAVRDQRTVSDWIVLALTDAVAGAKKRSK